MKLATTTGDFLSYTGSQTESIKCIHAAGFKYVDYNFDWDFEHSCGVFSADWKSHIDDVLKTADSLGMTFIQAHSPTGKPITKDENYENFIFGTKRCIECCAILGIKNLVVHSGYIQDISKDECFDLNKAFYLDLLHFAEKYDVNILVENFNKMHIDGMYWIDNAADQRAMIDYVNHPLFHACWDAGHGNMQETTQDEALRTLGEHVYALHVQDNMGNHDSHMAPYFGTLNMDSLMHGLIDIGYKGYFTFESGNIFLPARYRRPYDKDTRLNRAPLPLRISAEKLLYDIGKYTLDAYNMYEE